MNPDRMLLTRSAIVGGLALSLGAVMLVGCGEEPPPAQPTARVAPAPPPRPIAPPVKSVDDLMVELGIDDRVQLDERAAPNTTEDRRAVLMFFDAFARSEANQLARLLSPQDQAVLADLRSDDRWETSTNGIENIRISTGPRPDIVGVNVLPSTRLAVLAIFMVNGEYQPTMWYLGSGANGPEFSAAPTPPDILNRISGTDTIAAWHDVIREELARSQETDIDFRPPQQVLAQRQDPGAPGQPDQPGPKPPTLPGPGGPGGPGGPASPGTPID